jgi:hypothetical protein
MSEGKRLNEEVIIVHLLLPLMCLGWGDTKCMRHFDEENTSKTKEEIG